jgi:hypothetical protein
MVWVMTDQGVSTWTLILVNFDEFTEIIPSQNCLVTCTLGTAVAQCLRYCATNQKVADSIPDGVIGVFH